LQDPNFLYCHYVTYVETNGDLWQLDGRIPYPQNKGKLQESNLGVAVCNLVQEYLEKMPEDTKVSLMALAPNLPADLFEFD